MILIITTQILNREDKELTLKRLEDKKNLRRKMLNREELKKNSKISLKPGMIKTYLATTKIINVDMI